MNSRTSTIGTGELADELSAWAVGLGILTMVLAPFAIPLIALTAVVAAVLLAPVLVVALAIALLAMPVLLLRAAAGRGRRAWHRTDPDAGGRRPSSAGRHRSPGLTGA